MPVSDGLRHLEIAERFRRDAAGASGANRRRLLNLARIYDIEANLVRGSRRAIDESREMIARANKLLDR
jgi:hypothetical protein